MKIFVTGGAGFIGSALIRYLYANTDVCIINIDKLTYAGNLNSLPSNYDHKRYHFEKIDITNRLEISKLFKKYKPNAVMHLAAESHVDNSIENPDNFISTNIIGTYNLLEESRIYFNQIDSKTKNTFRFHHISTDEVYGDLDDNSLFTEKTSYNPSSPYSASKASSDHLVRAWHRTFDLPILVTNCSNNYGPYHFPEKFIPRVILNAINGVTIPIYGNGLQIRDWLYVDDHVDALYTVLKAGKVGNTYNIGGNNEKKNIEVAHLICEILERLKPNKPKGIKSYKDLINYVNDRPGHDVRYAIDASKIYNKLQWQPKETFETGINKTVEWYLNNEGWWKEIFFKNLKRTELDKQS